MHGAPTRTADRTWRTRLESLGREIRVLGLALRHPRTPWLARIVAACVVAYAVSPIDLIPDPIPVLGLLDDLILVPLGVALVVHLIPKDVMDECRARTAGAPPATPLLRVVGAVLVLVVWGLVLWWILA